MEAQLAVEAGRSRGATVTLLPGQAAVVGRGPGAQVALDDPAAAPQHVRVALDERGLWVTDLGPPGAARLADEALPPGQPVLAYAGDPLVVGGHLVRLTLLGREPAARRRRPPRGPLADPVVPAAEFELLRVLGAGAAGKVYAARWLPRDVVVALKVLHDDLRPGSPDFERFLRECATVARLKSPHVVATYDVRVVGGRAFSIMELVVGPTARDLVARGPLPLVHAVRVAHDVALALAAAAAVGVVHRDVKPANVVVATAQRVVKLCDFGIAKDLEAAARSLTLSGAGLGTMAYMAPEQVADAKRVDPSADVYGLGATLYHLLAGRPPFSPTTLASLAEIQDQAPPPLAELRPDAPPELVALVHAMLAKDPEDRPPLWQAGKRLAALLARAPGGDAGLFAGQAPSEERSPAPR